jgi:hypothetical protein
MNSDRICLDIARGSQAPDFVDRETPGMVEKKCFSSRGRLTEDQAEPCGAPFLGSETRVVCDIKDLPDNGVRRQRFWIRFMPTGLVPRCTELMQNVPRIKE